VLATFPGASVSRVEHGWQDRWREFHQPLRVGRLWVGPPWASSPSDAVPVVIDPGRAFGTGAHPTTRLVLELLLELPPASVLDLGCGSGVLAIAAALLGHAPVVAIDVDEAAVGATRANAAANGVEVDVRLLDGLIAHLPAADTALANIALEVVERIGARFAGRSVVTSGYLSVDEPELDGFLRIERRELDGWAADLHVRRRRPVGSRSAVRRHLRQ